MECALLKEKIDKFLNPAQVISALKLPLVESMIHLVSSTIYLAHLTEGLVFFHRMGMWKFELRTSSNVEVEGTVIKHSATGIRPEHATRCFMEDMVKQSAPRLELKHV
jgi:hypothetical protein